MTQKTNPWTFDVRVRERNLKSGSLTDKDLEKYLAQLPDNADQAEAFGTAQPALEQPELADDIDEGDDDESDDDVGGGNESSDDVSGGDDATGGGDDLGGGGGGESV